MNLDNLAIGDVFVFNGRVYQVVEFRGTKLAMELVETVHFRQLKTLTA